MILYFERAWKAFPMGLQGELWVLVRGFYLSYHNKETIY